MKDGGPAFPGEIDYNFPTSRPKYAPGMTLRDYFAANAMRLVVYVMPDSRSEADLKMAIRAYEIADAMLKARET